MAGGCDICPSDSTGDGYTCYCTSYGDIFDIYDNKCYTYIFDAPVTSYSIPAPGYFQEFDLGINTSPGPKIPPGVTIKSVTACFGGTFSNINAFRIQLVQDLFYPPFVTGPEITEGTMIDFGYFTTKPMEFKGRYCFTSEPSNPTMSKTAKSPLRAGVYLGTDPANPLSAFVGKNLVWSDWHIRFTRPGPTTSTGTLTSASLIFDYNFS